MEPQLLEFEGTWEEIANHARQFAGRRLRLTVLPRETESLSRTADQPSLEDKFAEIVADVPSEEWEKLPTDLGDNLDHYIYGTPKRG